jgi:glycerol-3-phosphate acyltransferase PlsX
MMSVNPKLSKLGGIDMTTIILDAMGSDHYPRPEVEAAVEAARRWQDPIILVGNPTVVEPLLAESSPSPAMVRLVYAEQVLEMTDKPASAARGKAANSMAVGMELLKAGEGQAFVTAGNTGGAMANALFQLGRLRGVKRPALAAAFPVRGGQAIVLDIGANADCRPEYLAQFAVLGSIFAEKVLNRSKPAVGLLSNGEEAGKGNSLVKEAFALLAESGVNFVGNVEPKEVYAGAVDVVVSDGFIGNIFLKTSEAVASFLIQTIRQQIRASALTTLGGLLARPAFKRIGDLLDPAEYGAAPLLGVEGLVFIGHGRSDARALVSAIRVARQAVESDLLGAMRQAMQQRSGILA